MYMKKTMALIALLALPTSTLAADGPYLFEFIANKETGRAYRTLIAKQKLPDWVKDGGTSTPANEVTIKGVRYLALSGCKPHNCPAQSIAVLYAIDKGDIHGVYSEYDMTNDRQTLKWMNIDPIDSDSMRGVLFSRLGGNVSK